MILATLYFTIWGMIWKKLVEEQLSCRSCYLLRGWFEKGRRRICGNSSSGDLISYLSDWKAARSWSWSWSSVKAINPPCLVVCASIFCVWEAKKNVVSEQHPKHYLHKTRQRLLILKILICRNLSSTDLSRETTQFISTKGALRLPTTYDNHPIRPSVHPHI